MSPDSSNCPLTRVLFFGFILCLNQGPNKVNTLTWSLCLKSLFFFLYHWTYYICIPHSLHKSLLILGSSSSRFPPCPFLQSSVEDTGPCKAVFYRVIWLTPVCSVFPVNWLSDQSHVQFSGKKYIMSGGLYLLHYSSRDVMPAPLSLSRVKSE